MTNPNFLEYGFNMFDKPLKPQIAILCDFFFYISMWSAVVKPALPPFTHTHLSPLHTELWGHFQSESKKQHIFQQNKKYI